jgi:hypothetical protein
MPVCVLPLLLLLLLLQWDCLSCAHCIIMEVATTAAFFVSFWYW